jgi:hypothetical protein
MPSPRNQLRQAAAALMPLCLLWVFAACVLICGREANEAHGVAAACSTFGRVGTEDAPDCEGCPVASYLTATTPGGSALRPKSQAAECVPASSLSLIASVDGVEPVSPSRRQFLKVPPPKLLPTLRI